MQDVPGMIICLLTSPLTHNNGIMICICLLCYSLSLSWCRAMVFPLKISSTAVFANKCPRLNTLLKTALTSWCVIMKPSCARFLAAIPMPSKSSKSVSTGASDHVT